ncbi:MAG: hypothetical protein ACK42C_08540 [Aquificaceae bacterium]|jgi:hypothetical protein|uniref:hypothetical protein n=1 Tax=Hydrogenobacter sp. Uz 6-8 TaxID=3384828 RepID=UPI000F16804D|nr:MAG: hypothetical protein D6804_08185 [Aquificota bacterium]
MERVEERVDRLERKFEWFIEEMADFKKWVMRYSADTDRKIEEYRADTDRKIAEYRAETDRRIEENRRENNKRWGEIANKLGTVVEDIVFPALRPVIRKYFNCEPEKTALRLEYTDRKRGIYEEFDAIAVCQDRVFLLEVKSTPREKHIEEFKEKARRFLQYFPEYADKRLTLIMGSLNLNEDFVKLLSKAGIYAMAYREWEYMDILNFEEVQNAQERQS